MGSMSQDRLLQALPVHGLERTQTESSLFLTNRSSLLEILQKLKAVDPESIVLNYLASDDPNLDDKSSEVSQNVEEFSDEILYHYGNKRTDLYVFAAYVPPGKHCILVRDTLSKQFEVEID